MIKEIHTVIDCRIIASVLHQIIMDKESGGDGSDTYRLLNVLEIEELCEVVGILKTVLPEFYTTKIAAQYHFATREKLH